MDARTRSTLTLLALCVVLVAMVVIGWRSATAAFPGLVGDSGSAACRQVKVTSVIRRSGVTVSVYNSTKRSGYADRTMGRLERKGFGVGTVGNAPSGTSVQGVQVRTQSTGDPRARLVAQQWRPTATITVTDEDLGPGVDVILGNGARLPAADAPKSLKLDKPQRTCLDKTTVNPTTGVRD